MAAYDADELVIDGTPQSAAWGMDFGVEGFVPALTLEAPPPVKMIGRVDGATWVSWVALGAPDFTGASYTGPGVLAPATISIAQQPKE